MVLRISLKRQCLFWKGSDWITKNFAQSDRELRNFDIKTDNYGMDIISMYLNDY